MRETNKFNKGHFSKSPEGMETKNSTTRQPILVLNIMMLWHFDRMINFDRLN